MAESFLSRHFHKSSDTVLTSSHIQRLTKQRSDALAYAKKWENDLKRATEQFNIRYKAFRQQLTILLHTINVKDKLIKDLEQQNKTKDKLLHKKSKIIIDKTAEIIKLKEIIKASQQKRANHCCTKRTKSCPQSSDDENGAHYKNHIESNSVSMYKHIISNHIKNEKKKKAPNKPLPALKEQQQNTQRPYIHQRGNTQTTTISQFATNISLPPSDKGSPLLQHTAAICSPMSEVQLSPISEKDTLPNAKPMMKLIALSDDNHNICQEWGKSIVKSEEEQKLSKVVDMRSKQFSMKYMRVCDENHSDNHSFSSSETSMSHRTRCKAMEQLELIDRKTSLGDVSYCSDNTMLLNDIKLNADHCLAAKRPHKVDNIKTYATRHFTQKSMETLSGCDIIQSPVNILSGIFNLNDGFDQSEASYPQKSK